MKLLPQALAAALLALAAQAASASTFSFSYTFDGANTGDGSPLTVTGQFKGALSGGVVQGISDMQVSVNGSAFAGPLFVEAWNAGTNAWDAGITPVISTDFAQNNFIVADTDVSTNPNVSNMFDLVSGSAVLLDFNQSDANGSPLLGFETGHVDGWTLTDLPEPASLPLLLTGLGLAVRLSQRRRSR